MYMKQHPVFLFTVALVSFFLFFCNDLKAQAPVQKKDTASIEGDWILKPVLASDTATGKLPYIKFSLLQNTFTGFTGCNEMSGALFIKGYSLSFDQNLALTKIACEGYNEKEFINSLLRVNAYKIEDGILVLMDNKTPLSKWARKNGMNKL